MKRARLVMLALLLAPLVSCERRAPKGSQKEISIGISRFGAACLPAIAKVEGYFRDEGLPVRIVSYESGSAALSDMLRGKVDFAASAETPILRAVLAGEDIGVIATIGHTRDSSAIVARKDRGILTPRDLAGKRIGVTQYTSADFFLGRFLSAHGIPWKKVRETYLPISQLPAALAGGDIDAVSVWEPHVNALERRLGDNAVVFAGNLLYSDSHHLTGRRDRLERDPQVVRALLRALIRAERDAIEPADDLIPQVAAAMDYDGQELRANWEHLTLRVSLDQDLISMLDQEARWAYEKYALGQPPFPNFMQFVYWDGLGAVAPDAVTVVRSTPK